MDKSSTSHGKIPSSQPRCHCPRARDTQVNCSNAFVGSFVEPTTPCCRAQTFPPVSSSGGYPARVGSERLDDRYRPSSVPVSPSMQQGSFPQSGIYSAAPIRNSPPQMPVPHSDPWSGPSAGQAHISTHRSSLISSPESNAHTTTRLPEGHTEGQIPVAYGRPQRKSSNRDEFDGPHQLLNIPSPRSVAAKDQPFPILPMTLSSEEQDDILGRLNEVLSKCAFDFVARYQFPIPVEPEKRLVITPQDRDWTEWVYLLKRLATKRRIPARALHENQIKQLVTVLENSLDAPYTASHQSRPLKDDRSVLQFISAGTQVARILKDAAAMGHLDRLYSQTASCIQDRRWTGLPI